MNCDSCLKINAIPECIDSDAFVLNGLTFPDFLNEVLMIRITDTATGRVENFPEVIDGSGEITGGFDIAAMYPLMNHWYKMEFMVQGSPANFILTNPDQTEATGCCIEFTVLQRLTGSDEWDLTSEECAV